MNHDDVYYALQDKLHDKEACIRELEAALRGVVDQGGSLRAGGPYAEDALDLHDALDRAVEIADEALATPPPDSEPTEAQWHKRGGSVMGTNYYWISGGVCPACGNWDEEKELHIGKSSFGWCFALHVIPEQEIDGWDAWREVIEANDGEIRDEYGNQVSLRGLTQIVTERAFPEGKNPSPTWLEQNGAQKGPNGLVRSRIDGLHCVGHGSGTWDLIAGEFS